MDNWNYRGFFLEIFGDLKPLAETVHDAGKFPLPAGGEPGDASGDMVIFIGYDSTTRAGSHAWSGADASGLRNRRLVSRGL